MLSLTAHSHYDAHVEIDQCPKCGGLWFDGTEFYVIKQGLGDVIDKVDRKKLYELVPTAIELHCPRDGAHLTLFKDRSFSVNIQVESCPTCGGFWFNRGEFRDWQDARAEKMKANFDKADEKFDSDIASLFSLYSTNGGNDALDRLGNFMAAAYGVPGSQPVKTDEPDIEKTAQAIALADNLISLFKKPSVDPKTPSAEREEILAQARVINLALKILAAGLSAYFIISEARIAIDTKIFYSQIDISIWYFRMMISFFVLPVFYAFKFVNFIQNKYFPEIRMGTVSSTFLQAKMFYYTVYGILFLLVLARIFS
jgi:uncharacterized protein